MYLVNFSSHYSPIWFYHLQLLTNNKNNYFVLPINKVDDNAIVIQKYYRRKIGTRLAWERRKIVSAERIQRCIRSWNEYKKNFVAHLRVHSCIRIQKWWKKYLYMKISLRDRIWECLQNQKRLEEEERRKYEKKYFGARAIQCWYRRIRAVRCLTLLQLKRKITEI